MTIDLVHDQTHFSISLLLTDQTSCRCPATLFAGLKGSAILALVVTKDLFNCSRCDRRERLAIWVLAITSIADTAKRPRI